MRSGHALLSDGKLQTTGQSGYLWSSYGYLVSWDGANVPSARVVGIGDAKINASAGPAFRWYGLPLRCLSTVLDIVENAKTARR